MMEAVQTSETLVNLHKSTRLYNPEDSYLRKYRYIKRRIFKLKYYDCSGCSIRQDVCLKEYAMNMYRL
jgi:Pyruvate/2-oxoacid:ferredoxin oxidoreductase delta subunit